MPIRTLSLLMLLLALGAGCGSDKGPTGEANTPGDGDGDGDGPGPGPGDDGSTDHKPGVTPEQGATEFVSADSRGGESGSRSGDLAGAPESTDDDASSDGGGEQRTVERGDIFRVLGDGRILNLNAYRGLQILDVRDVNAPRIEGSLDLTGTPVEMYVVGDRAIVLLNNWRGYYGSREDVAVEVEEGGLVAVVDISDRAQPVLLDERVVDGNIQTSRLTQGDGVALYVAAQEYGDWSEGDSGVHTILRSFDASADELVEKSSLDLGGYVQDIQATTSVMMVASTTYDSINGEQRSSVALVDISSPDGTMELGATVQPMGFVANKFNMDVHGDVLRIVSGSSWNGTTNHLETFDISSLDVATPLDHCTMGDGQQLFATLFVENKAFFVTYLRQDPFHAFSIDDAGQCEEHNEFIVSGWNDFFRATLDDTRLVGIGVNDENNARQLAVSLYDITDIDNPDPLIDRDEIDLSGWSSSEAQWDDRAFSVLEGAVSVDSNGVEETGLILLPFQGWDSGYEEYTAAVQVLTFSATTLTRRGVMDHGSSVRRSFMPSDGTAANLSEEQLSLYDLADPDAPEELGRVDVAPSFSQVIPLSDAYVARVRDRGYYYYNPSGTVPNGQVEIVERAGDIDADAAVASFEIPSGAQLVKVGALLVSISSVYRQTEDPNATKAEYDTTIAVFDVSDPTAPRARGTLVTDQIVPSYGGYYGYPYRGGLLDIDCFDCGGYYGYGGGTTQLVAGNAIVFPETEYKSEVIGQAEYCYSYPERRDRSCVVNAAGECEGTYFAGGIQCTRPVDEDEGWCTGDVYECNYDGSGCELVGDEVEMTETCHIQEQYRSWTQYSFEVLSLEDPDAPALAATITTPEKDEGTLAIAHGSDIYFSYQQPHDVANDPRPYVKRFVRKLDVSDPSAPSLGAGINVPGDVIAVSGSSIFTRDIVWDDYDAETLIARLELDGAVARLRAQRLFDQRMVQNVSVDGSGHVLVSHDPVWSYLNNQEQPEHTLSILAEDDLGVEGATPIDAWASFTAAEDGKALFSVSGGVLVVNVEDPSAPRAQAYFATDGYWMSNVLLDNGEILLAAGPYGIHRFDSDTYNLRTK